MCVCVSTVSTRRRRRAEARKRCRDIKRTQDEKENVCAKMAISLHGAYESLMESSANGGLQMQGEQAAFAIPSIANSQMHSAETNEQETDRTLLSSGSFRRLHISNIPFRYREHDLRKLLGVRSFFFALLFTLLCFCRHVSFCHHDVVLPTFLSFCELLPGVILSPAILSPGVILSPFGDFVTWCDFVTIW